MRIEVKGSVGSFELYINEEEIGTSFESIDIVVNRIKTFLKARFT